MQRPGNALLLTLRYACALDGAVELQALRLTEICFLSNLAKAWADYLIDGILSFATISLALKVPRISDPRTQQVAVVIWGAVIFVMYSFLLSTFRIKVSQITGYISSFIL